MKTYPIVILSLALSYSLNLFAHGEDKLGPNGGYVQMPANYHTEVVQDGKNKLKVYLLDIEWKNPSVNNSKVEILHKTKKATPALCKAIDNYFMCELPQRIDLTKKAQLIVKSTRDGQSGIDVTYKLPLKLEITEGGHH